MLVMGLYHPNRNIQKQNSNNRPLPPEQKVQKQNANNGPLLPDQKQTEAETDLSLRKQNVELGVH